VVSQVHLADLASGGTGEGASFVAEEFVFDEGFGDGGAVEGHEGFVAARGKMMDGAGEEFFACATFAEKEHSGVGGGYALELLANFTDRGVLTNDARKSVACGIFLAE
jgi:hypothetical protein